MVPPAHLSLLHGQHTCNVTLSDRPNGNDDGDGDGDGDGGDDGDDDDDDDVMVLVMMMVAMMKITMMVKATGRRRKLEEYGGVRRRIRPVL